MWHIPDKSVHFSNIDIIQLLDSRLDVVFVGAGVNNEHQRVVVLNLLHCCFGGQGELDDVVSIHAEK